MFYHNYNALSTGELAVLTTIEPSNSVPFDPLGGWYRATQIKSTR